MKAYSLSHLSDRVLLHDLAALVAQDRVTTAAMLAHLAEVDARRLYLPAGYSSMYAWCVGELKLSEDSTAKRIQAARLARSFPAIFSMLADGRLHLSAVVLLAPHLTPENVDKLLAAAASKSKPELERLIAERFPRPDLPTLVTPLAACESEEQHAPGHVHVTDSEHVLGPASERASEPRSKLTPLSPGKVALQVTIAQATHDKLRYAQSLLGHALPSGDLAQVLDRALDVLIAKLEQRRFAASARTRPSRRLRAADTRYVPAEIRRMVWQRDGGQCTFVSGKGHRCETRKFLEFDHLDAFARGGQATPDRMRLLCRAHNQHAAERTYGADFMHHQRDQARRGGDTAQEAAVAGDPSRAHEAGMAHEAARVLERECAVAARARMDEVIPWLRSLGVTLENARRAAAACADMPDNAPLEVRVRAALKRLAPHGARRVPHAPTEAP